MNRANILAAGIGALVLIVVGLSSLYTVNMTQQALLLQFGKPEAVVSDAGLHGKVPFVQDVVYIPKMLLNVDAPSEEVIAADRKRLVVDAFARYRITDPLRFYQTLSDPRTALVRLTPILSSNMRRVIGSRSFASVLSTSRDGMMRQIARDMNQEVHDFGVRVVDVRIRRADLPAQNSQAIFERMKKERERDVNAFLGEGRETEQRIKANADRDVTVLLAEATRDGQILRGEGDAEKTRILGEAYKQDPEFFNFYRSMQAYTQAFSNDNSSLILSPDSEFFRYFGHGGGH